jgi:ABC-2 type transport system permease protein
MADALTILWKEWKEILHGGGGRGKLGILLFLVVFGVALPWQMGREWIASPLALVYWAWLPLFMVNTVVADAFAGERERHTLETLLASRLPDRAILFGKIGAAMGYGVGLTWLSLLLGLVTTSLVDGAGRMLMYPPEVGIGIMAFSLVGAGLAAGGGVLVSLRAATVRQAQQTLNIAIMVLLFVPLLGLRALPAAWQARAAAAAQALGPRGLTVAVVAALALVAAGLLAAAVGRFRRAQLLLD